MRLASITASKFLVLFRILPISIKESKVGTSIKGICNPKHNPLAVETPILRPVYEPGPEEIETADKASIFKFALVKASIINNVRLSA